MIFDLFHTLIHGADDERNRVVAQMAVIVGVELAALVRPYHDTWRQRFIRWTAAQTVQILAERLGGFPSQAQVAQAAALRNALVRRLLS
ncbi:hypothetical protein HC031_29620 [Planosporangium thailandense]|uniref:Uncharacterized protein n=1 Tax=Planosporangium thailandense TaxID=765197 RepID=A0ABX0Y8W1_9ACTN|nr:hypothetical protein [Planosporangium thailandense]NJC73842.1 hypothetical protein [Planosporangium thailandense]